MLRRNRVIELLKLDQPVYYVSTSELTRENGRAMSNTWGDYIRLDLEHGPFDIRGVREFMLGLREAGPTASGHVCPPVIAELPIDGTSESVMRANAWMVKQLLGVHGLILCHAESPKAVRAFVESARFAFHMAEENLGQGRRGHGGAKEASTIWGVTSEKYLNMADPWPLNPDGELLLGVKCENCRAALNSSESIAVPGIAFAEWGAGDMCMSYGFKSKPSPLTEELADVRKEIVDACSLNGVFFLCIADEDNIIEHIDAGARILRVHDPKIAEKGKAYTKRKAHYSTKFSK